MAKIGFKLSVEILLAVFSVSKRVKSVSIVAILIEYNHRNLVMLSNFKLRSRHDDSVVFKGM
jgi:hypothetical protein